ncbi:MAG TPA: class I SAM-dependent methyltransferase, partial [Bryobacteraceae bacterium]|nr:class I SAM-dependent methyltransferase [Bryobacteraceae bacterium]
MNIRRIVAAIHAEAESEEKGARHFNGAGLNSSEKTSRFQNDLGSLRGSYERLYQMRALVGQMPPSPDTLRARIGARLVRLVQRMLFWYTPQIHRVQQEITSSIGSLCRLIEAQTEEIAILRKELRSAQSARAFSPTPVTASGGQTPPPLPPAFEFALQDRFRGSEQETAAKLDKWFRMMESVERGSGGSWLDIGCGRGEWLKLAARRGYDALGIDLNPAAVEHCRANGLKAEEADAGCFLRAAADETFALITMFHVAEHLTPEYLLELLALAWRKLRPGGLLAIETPNPANLLIGSNLFWNDPTHQRPLPEPLLGLMIEFAGFSVVRRA